jgi:hypothetical protein
VASVLILADVEHLIVWQAFINTIVLKPVPVEPAQPPIRAEPEKATTVLIDIVNHIAWQPVLNGIVTQQRLLTPTRESSQEE